jgi:transposase
VFLDETWFTTAMTRTHGYAPRGEPLIDSAPLRHWTRLTFVAGLTLDGMIAPRLFEGSINGKRFEDYLRHALVPHSRPGDLLVLDNLPAHKTQSVRMFLKQSGIAVRHLPPYSPDRNPIELAFSKLKRMARAAAERAIHSVKKLVRSLSNKLTPEECRNYITHCGYTLR